MIFEVLISIIFGLIELLLNLLFPIILLPSEFLGGIAGFLELLSSVTFLMPIGTLVICTVWVIAMHQYEFFMSVFNWLVRKIPGLS